MRPCPMLLAYVLLLAAPALGAGPNASSPLGDHGADFGHVLAPPLPGAPAPLTSPPTSPGRPATVREQVLNVAPTVILFAVASLVPAAVLMATAFVRINIVLTLLRQALGSPQVPGNQVLAALALLLTALVMKPQAEAVYVQGIEPYASGRKPALAAWEDGTRPLRAFMIRQLVRTRHEYYLRDLHALAEPNQPEPEFCEEYPLHVLAPAFLISELTTALSIAFAVYLPFLVIDLVVSAVLAAMGLVMLPPSLVAMPLKLVVFVLADGWLLVSGMLLRGFG